MSNKGLKLKVTNRFILKNDNGNVPTSENDTAEAGNIVWDEDHLHIAVEDNVWKSIPLSSFQKSGSGGAGFNPETIIYADSFAPNGGDGSPSLPFNSLQEAIDAAKLVGQDKRKVIMVAPNSAFDEDVKVVSDHLAILCSGAWTLGDAAGAEFASTTPRNFTWEQDSNSLPANGRPTLVIGSHLTGEGGSTHIAYASSATISGDLILTNPSSPTTHELHLFGFDIKGDFDCSADQGQLNVYCKRGQFDGAFNCPVGNLQLADSVEFDELITVVSYGRISNSQIQGGITTGGIASGMAPAGFYNCEFSGQFDGAIFSGSTQMLLDAVTNYWFNANSATIINGSRTLIHDETV